MSIFNVTIYLETTIKGPRPRMAVGAYLVEYITSRNEPETRGKILFSERITENALTLSLLSRALDELSKTSTCSIRVNTQCEHVSSAVGKGWVEQWKGNGWLNAKGLPVKNAELWQQVSRKMERHLVVFDSWDHSYRNIMRKTIHSILDEKKEKRAGMPGGKEHTNKQCHVQNRTG